MGAIIAHRVPEKVADGTCTRVRAWMTDKCRKKMNGGVGYITTEVSQKRDGLEEGGQGKGERPLGCERNWGF